MRLLIAAVLLATLAIPVSSTLTRAGLSTADLATDLSAARKKVKKKKMKAPKEEYLRAAPMAPPSGQKM